MPHLRAVQLLGLLPRQLLELPKQLPMDRLDEVHLVADGVGNGSLLLRRNAQVKDALDVRFTYPDVVNISSLQLCAFWENLPCRVHHVEWRVDTVLLEQVDILFRSHSTLRQVLVSGKRSSMSALPLWNLAHFYLSNLEELVVCDTDPHVRVLHFTRESLILRSICPSVIRQLVSSSSSSSNLTALHLVDLSLNNATLSQILQDLPQLRELTLLGLPQLSSLYSLTSSNSTSTLTHLVLGGLASMKQSELVHVVALGHLSSLSLHAAFPSVLEDFAHAAFEQRLVLPHLKHFAATQQPLDDTLYLPSPTTMADVAVAGYAAAFRPAGSLHPI